MASAAVSANLKTGAALSGLCIGIYMYTMRHLKTVAPGDIDRMVSILMTFYFYCE